MMAKLVKGRLVMSESEYFNAGAENLGYCISCGESMEECEPDSRGRHCDACHEDSVYGTEELMMMERVHIKEWN